MAELRIRGGVPLSGTHHVPGNKNAALPMIAAALLTAEPVTLRNLPDIQDVRVMLQGVESLGAKVTYDPTQRTAQITATAISDSVSKTICTQIRTSILFAAPLLARKGCARLSPPGGDTIGRRRLDTHINGLKALGVTMPRFCSFKTAQLVGTYFMLDEPSVTATENLIMAAVCAKGATTLYNAACEPHICDLCHMLNAMGAQITGVGTNRIEIRGVTRLHGGDFTVGPDYIEAASYLTAALVTQGSLTLTGIRGEDFKVFEHAFATFGVKWTIEGDTLRLPRQKLKMRYDFGQVIPKIEDGPWPMIPSDLLSILIVLATQTRGTALFFEKMFESRMYFVDRLIDMGARIVQCDPHRVVVTGPATLQGIRAASPDIRAGMALLIAALCAKRETIIGNIESIDRGYEHIEQQLSALGAQITRV